MIRLPQRLRTRVAASAHDLAMVPLAWFAAYWLRFNLQVIPESYLGRAMLVLPALLLIQGAAFHGFGLYRGVWRFASMPDLIRILKAVGVGTVSIALALFLFNRLEGVPRSVPALYALLLTVFLAGPRFVYRWSQDRGLYSASGRRALIVGAGRTGEMLARELLRGADRAWQPVAFVDDDQRRWGKDIHGIPVAGACASLVEIAARENAEAILIAMPSARPAELRRIYALCEKTGLSCLTLPPFERLVSGHAVVRGLRQVAIEDLLGRDSVQVEWQVIRRGISGKRVRVTGAGGSIGSELCRQIAALDPALLILLERSEYHLYQIERELHAREGSVPVEPVLCDVCDVAGLGHVFARHRPEVVFHAAAHKHVPLLEKQVREAARNNVLGTAAVAQAAARHGTGLFVLVSTDKAVDPSSVMGATKRSAEVVGQALLDATATRFVAVRFGNVLDSAGSVVPLFREQIARGGPVTVTHPEITRYFMTIPEACQLILQAAVMGQGGEVFVLDMGEPIRIRDLAEQMIRLTGKEPETDIAIVYTGLRPGEKLHEVLFHDEERPAVTTHPRVMRARSRPADTARLAGQLDRLTRAVDDFAEGEALALLREMVPEFSGGAAAEGGKVVPLEQIRKDRER